MHLTTCLVFYSVMIFLVKLLRSKVYFHSPSVLGQVLFCTLELIVKTKRRKLILHMNLFKAFIFQHSLNLKLFFLKSKAQVIKLICYVTENINMRLRFKVRGGDKALEQHLKNCSKNASYISKTSQNDLICCCRQFITEFIVRKIKENLLFFNISR